MGTHGFRLKRELVGLTSSSWPPEKLNARVGCDGPAHPLTTCESGMPSPRMAAFAAGVLVDRLFELSRHRDNLIVRHRRSSLCRVDGVAVQKGEKRSMKKRRRSCSASRSGPAPGILSPIDVKTMRLQVRDEQPRPLVRGGVSRTIEPRRAGNPAQRVPAQESCGQFISARAEVDDSSIDSGSTRAQNLTCVLGFNALASSSSALPLDSPPLQPLSLDRGSGMDNDPCCAGRDAGDERPCLILSHRVTRRHLHM